MKIMKDADAKKKVEGMHQTLHFGDGRVSLTAKRSSRNEKSVPEAPRKGENSRWSEKRVALRHLEEG